MLDLDVFSLQFLTKNPVKRLGSGNEQEEVRSHSFFKRIDWNKIEAREVQPPIIPKLVRNWSGDVSLDITCYK